MADADVYVNCLRLTNAISEDPSNPPSDDDLGRAFDACVRCELMIKDTVSDAQRYQNVMQKIARLKRLNERTECDKCRRMNGELEQEQAKVPKAEDRIKMDPNWTKRISLQCMECAARHKRFRQIKDAIMAENTALLGEEGKAELAALGRMPDVPDDALVIAERIMRDRQAFLDRMADKGGRKCYQCSSTKFLEAATMIATDIRDKMGRRGVLYTDKQLLAMLRVSLDCVNRLRNACAVDIEFKLGTPEYLTVLPDMKQAMDEFYNEFKAKLDAFEAKLNVKEWNGIPPVVAKFMGFMTKMRKIMASAGQ